MNRHRTCDRLVFLLLNLYLCLYRNIFFPEKFQRFFNTTQVNEILFMVKFIGPFTVNQFFIKFIIVWRNFRFNFCGEVLEFLKQFFIHGITGHTDIAPGEILFQCGFKFAAVMQPVFQFFNRIYGPVAKVFVKRFQVFPFNFEVGRDIFSCFFVDHSLIMCRLQMCGCADDKAKKIVNNSI